MAHRSGFCWLFRARNCGTAPWPAEPDRVICVCYRGTAPQDMFRPIRPAIQRRFSMTITSAHIPAIVALIAGILILLMPRLLNFVVAIYLIFVGLVGLGVLKMFHLG
jgi:hypothetical protein